MKNSQNYSGPLKGLNVIDFGHYYAGPIAAMLLAEQGANVIRIVKPGKKEIPTAQYRLANRNKKLLELDLKSEEGKSKALQLIEKADVLIENFRPGVMKRLGLDFAATKKVNPSLIYLSMPGFASTDKERAHIQAWEGVMAAAAGVYTLTSPFRNKLKFPPVYTSVMNCSLYGAIHGPVAIMAALIAREKHGYGTFIEAPLVDLGVSGFYHEISWINQYADLPDSLKSIVYSQADSRDEVDEKLTMATELTMVGPTSLGFPCSDGREIWVYTQENEKFIKRFYEAIGLDKTLMKNGFVHAGQWEFGLDNNLDAPSALNTELKDNLLKLIRSKMLTKTAIEWESILQDAGVPASLTRTRDEWLSLEPLKQAGLFSKMTNEDSEITVPGRVVDVSGEAGSLIDVNSFIDAKEVDFDNAFTLFSQSFVHRKLDNKDPELKKGDLLRDVKVLDLSNVAAGPVATFILAQYGAEIIKSDPPNVIGAVIPQLVITTATNSGKKSIITDATSKPGREVLEKLISWADVVHHNCIDKTSKRLGVSYEQIQQLNPNAVVGQITAFGATLRGGWENRLGFEPVVSSACGMTIHYGNKEVPQWHGQGSNTDGYGGICFAFGELLGVFQKRTTGVAGEVRTSLSRAVNLMQLPSMILENGSSDWNEPSGQFAVGPHWYDRMYKCSDRWIYVATTEENSADLLEVVAGGSAFDKDKFESTFQKQSSDFWLAELSKRGIPCHLVCDAKDFLKQKARPVGREAADEIATDSCELVSINDHVKITGETYTCLVPNWVRVGENQTYKRLSASPAYGENAVEILEKLGFSSAKIEEFLNIKAVHEYMPQLKRKKVYTYLPS